MSDANNATDTGGGGGGGDNNTINWVALVVSLVALIGTIAQVLQQYYASAQGYQNCDESVIGEWHKSKKRRFRLSEFRFEVQFESPVIFVCPPGNTRGPVPGQPIKFVKGTQESLIATRTLLAKEENQRLMALKNNQVHTADNERATWVTLLSHLQTMEQESKEWQENQLKRFPPPGPSQMAAPLAGIDQHTLVVAIQSKKRSWDTMPPDVRKPYATTTICHLLEIAAMMGIYWKEFDRSREKYRAEGNGYMLTGTNIHDLGLMFTFRITGKSQYGENRVIPVDEVKEMCCGSASTIFQETKDNRRLEFPNEDSKDLALLQLGSMPEIAETMVQLECNTNTADYFLRKGKHTHLFPVPFELLGMLGKTLHIRNSYYRMLPNPTPCHWDKNFFSIRRLLKEFRNRIADEEILCQEGQITELEELAITVVDTIKTETRDPKVTGYSITLLNTLHDALDKCDKYLRAETRDRDLVRMVLREHFQEVLKMINEDDDDKVAAENASRNGDVDSEKRRATQFSELSSANPEERQEKFMDIYFYVVLHQVRERAVHSYLKRKNSTTYAPSLYAREDTPDHLAASPSMQSVHTGTRAASAPSSPTLTATTRPASPPSRLISHRSSQSTPTPFLMIPRDSATPQPLDILYDASRLMDSDLGREAAGIWCTLVFRMLCWLLLHDFHKKDVQIPKSELLGSRLPVYIA